MRDLIRSTSKAVRITGLWVVIGGSLAHWATDKDDKTVSLSGDAYKFLEAAPDVEAVLKGYASHISPRGGWSGSQADEMQSRADAIAALAGSNNRAIARAAEAVLADVVKWIDQVRRRERTRDEDREQRFE